MINYINSDCFEAMAKMKDKSVDCIVTDPPYGIDFHGKYDPDTEWDKIDNYDDFIYKVLIELKRILKDDGIIWMCMGITQLPTLLTQAGKAGLICNYDKWLVYSRAKGRGSKKKLKSIREEVVCFTKSSKFVFDEKEWIDQGVTPFLTDDKPRGWKLDVAKAERVRWDGKGDVLHFSAPYYLGVGEKMIHSCQKPLLLWLKLIMSSTKENDLVFDPFAGSFSSGIACLLSGRNFEGCELDKDMYEKALQWKDLVEHPTEKVENVLNSYIKKH